MDASGPATEEHQPLRRRARPLSWLLALVVVAGAGVGADRLGASSDDEGGVARYDPVEPGSTWVYRTTTNDGPPASAFARVAGFGTVFADGEARSVAVIESRFEDYAGFGPYEQLRYQGIDEARSQFGARRGGRDYQGDDPPIPWLRGPLTPEASWTYTGTVAGREQTIVTRVVDSVDLDVAGERLEGCLHLHRTYRFADDPEAAEDGDEWRCPGVGAVRLRNEVPAQDLLFEQELVAFRSTARVLGDPSAELPAEAVPDGSSAGFADPGRSRFVSGELAGDRPAWLDARAGFAIAPPGGGDGLFVLGEEDGTLSATEPETGHLRWRVGLPPPIVATPVVSDGLVLAADGEKDLFALDAETGATRWVRRLPDVVSATPVVAGGVVTVAVDDRTLRGISLEDGSVRWTRSMPDLVKGALAFGDGVVVAGDVAGNLRAVDPGDGAVRWEVALDAALVDGPAIDGTDVVAVDDSAAVSAYDARTGRLRWTRPLGAYAVPKLGPAVGADAVVVATETTTGSANLRVLDRRTGEERWRSSFDAEIASAPLIAGERIVLATDAGDLLTFDLLRGGAPARERLPRLDPTLDASVAFDLAFADRYVVAAVQSRSPWFHTLYVAFDLSSSEAPGVALTAEARRIDGSWRSPPALSGDELVYVSSGGGVWSVGPGGAPDPLLEIEEPIAFVSGVPDGVVALAGRTLYALDPSTGAERWRAFTGAGGLGAGASFGDGRVFVSTQGPAVVALDEMDGSRLWRREFTGIGLGAPLVLPQGDPVVGIGQITRLAAGTGDPVWTIEDTSSFGPMALDGDRLFAVTERITGNALIGVDADTGSEAWSFPLDAALLIGPGAGDGVVVAVDRRGSAFALDAASGTPLWTLELSTPPCGSPVVRDGVAYLMEGGRGEDLNERDYRVVAVRADTGRFLASFEPLGSTTFPGDCAALSNGRIAVSGALYAQLLRMETT